MKQPIITVTAKYEELENLKNWRTISSLLTILYNENTSTITNNSYFLPPN